MSWKRHIHETRENLAHSIYYVWIISANTSSSNPLQSWLWFHYTLFKTRHYISTQPFTTDMRLILFKIISHLNYKVNSYFYELRILSVMEFTISQIILELSVSTNRRIIMIKGTMYKYRIHGEDVEPLENF